MLTEEMVKGMDALDLWGHVDETVEGVSEGLSLVAESEDIGNGGRFIGDAAYRLDGVLVCVRELCDRYRNAPKAAS